MTNDKCHNTNKQIYNMIDVLNEPSAGDGKLNQISTWLVSNLQCY